MNFGNRNSTCEYGKDDMIRGYCVAVGSALSIGFGIRKATASITQGATGNRVIIFNTLIQCCAGTTAGFCNSMAMRYCEVQKGI